MISPLPPRSLCHEIIMPLPRRFLQPVASAEAAAPPPEPVTVDSDIVVILAALLCALICVVGLALVARCAWLRRSPSPASGHPPPPPLPNKGLKKKVLKSLPKVSFHQAFSSDGKLSAECPICLAEFAGGDEIRILPQCGHGFHVACVDTWLRSHSSCPSCRQILVAAFAPGAGAVAAAAAAAGAAGCASSSRCRSCGASAEEVEVGSEEAAADDVGPKAREDGDAGRF